MSRGKAYAFIFLVSVMLSCGRGNDGRFARIDALCDLDPRLAMSMLDSIDYGSLSEKDRHLHDLLSIKSRDKAYVMHTSDSLILDVIDYYSSHKNDSHYPEVLYYGGRVYSDIGDLPAALKYFQNAIDAVPDKKENARFRSILLNQTGRLLHSLRLDSAAVEYLEKSILLMATDGERSSDLLFSHGLIDASYMGMNDLKNARCHMDEALQDSSSLGKIDSAVYKILREKIDKRSCIVETEDIWNSINGIIESASTGFNERLELLTDGRITATERKIAHLTKFGFSPMEISVLMSRGRNTISSQRRSLANKISKEKDILSSLNAVIVLL